MQVLQKIATRFVMCRGNHDNKKTKRITEILNVALISRFNKECGQLCEFNDSFSQHTVSGGHLPNTSSCFSC